MTRIKIDLAAPPTDGMDIKFKAPCDCTEVTGLLVTHPDGNQEFTFRDCLGNNLAGLGNLFAKDAYVKAILDTGNGRAYLQNADNNSFVNSGILGTYTQSAATLTGSGVNGKFKCTESGTYGSLQVNGSWCNVRQGEETSIDLIAGCWYTFILDGDTINFNSGGTGAGLNFKVVGGTTEPVSPSENTIWVNTGTPISDWVFSAAEPEDPVEGMVWFTVALESSVKFNALKKHGIMIYPGTAKQYTAGEWASADAYLRQDGAWAQFSLEWDGFYFKDGDQYEEITGGWSSDGWDSYSTSTVVVGDVLSVLTPAAAYVARVGTNDPVDLTGVDTIWYDSPNGKNGHGYSGYLMVCTEKSENSKVASATITNAGTGSIDVSSLSGPHYLLLRAIGGSAVGDKKGYADIRAIWKE